MLGEKVVEESTNKRSRGSRLKKEIQKISSKTAGRTGWPVDWAGRPPAVSGTRSTGPVDRGAQTCTSWSSVDRPVDRAPNRELGHFSRSTDRSTELPPCASCARRSTGPVDRSPATAGGRPGRSTEHLLLLLLTCFAAAASFVFRRRLPRRSLDDPCRLPPQSLDNPCRLPR